MAIKGAFPITLKPAGLTDALDSTETFVGASLFMQNLIFDQGSPEISVARPGVGSAVITATQIQTQVGSGTATYISIHQGIGTRVYGMVSMTGGTFAGLDVPFVYDFSTNTFVNLTGIAAANLPSSPLTSGPWNPPTIASVGIYVLFTHPGWSGTGTHFFGAINTSTNAWTVQNLATNPLPALPIAVSNFNNRAYFAIGNQSFYTDTLSPLTATNAGQVVTHGDNSPVTGYAGLPVATSTGGVVQQLLVLKPSQIWFIAGDAAIVNTLLTNFLSLTLGSSAPRTIAQSPQGVYVVGTDGAMLIDQLGIVRRVAFDQHKNSDVRVPFVNAPVQSRMAGAFASNIYRIFVQNTIVQGVTVSNDYWFDTIRQRWNGPHTFAYDCASQFGTYFLLSGPATGANLFRSDPNTLATSIYTDNGSPYTCQWTSADFPKTGHVNTPQIVESTQELGGPSINYSISMQNDEGSNLGSSSITTTAQGFAWDSGPTWDSGVTWGVSTQVPSTYTVPWPNPIIAPKLQLNIIATATVGLLIGAHISRYKDAGYVLAHTGS